MTLPATDVFTPYLMWKSLDFDAEALACEVTQQAFTHADKPEKLAGTDVEISVVLGNDEMIQTLNLQYRKKDAPTNVLSFATMDAEDWAVDLNTDAPFSLGDIMMGFETIESEAQEQTKTLRDHYTHLLIHGTLHLLGYDHEEEEEALIMEGLEIKILNLLGIKNPYSDV